jgi:hypothetical protein
MDNSNEKYELRNITLENFHKKNKIYKQFDSIEKIADIIKNKIEKNNFILRIGCILNLKYTNEYDEEEYIPFEIKKIDSFSNSSSSSQEAELKRLKSENDRLRRENSELKAQMEKLASGQKAISPTPQKKANTDISIEGDYVPPSMDKNGTIWERIDHCLKLKKDMKKTLDELNKRLNESKKKLIILWIKLLLIILQLKIKKKL